MYFASVTCGSLHLNQTSKHVLANKGIEVKSVFSLMADALIFYLWVLNLLWVGTGIGVFIQMLSLLFPKFQFNK